MLGSRAGGDRRRCRRHLSVVRTSDRRERPSMHDGPCSLNCSPIPASRRCASCDRRSGCMAFHGGNLEKATDTVATRVADEAGASLYAVLQPSDLRWHIPSTAVQPAASPQLAKFIEHVDVAVAVHGYGREGFWTTVLLGGAQPRARPPCRRRAAHVDRAARLHDGRRARRHPDALRGVHPRNPVNLPPVEGRAARATAPRARHDAVEQARVHRGADRWLASRRRLVMALGE